MPEVELIPPETVISLEREFVAMIVTLPHIALFVALIFALVILRDRAPEIFREHKEDGANPLYCRFAPLFPIVAAFVGVFSGLTSATTAGMKAAMATIIGCAAYLAVRFGKQIFGSELARKFVVKFLPFLKFLYEKKDADNNP